MKINNQYKCIVALFLLFFVSNTIFGIDEKVEKTLESVSVKTLSKYETLGLILYDYSNGLVSRNKALKQKGNLYFLVDKGVLSLASKLLLKDNFPELHKANVVRMLGYIGNEHTVVVISDYISSLSGKLTSPQRRVLQKSIESLAVLERRGVKGAENLLNKMLMRKYWENSSIQVIDPRVPHGNINELLARVVWACRLTKRDSATLRKNSGFNFGNISEEGQIYLRGRLSIKKMLNSRLANVMDEQREISASEKRRLKELGDSFKKLIIKLQKIDRSYERMLKLVEKLSNSNNRQREVVENKNVTVDKSAIFDRNKVQRLMKIPNDKFLEELYTPQRIASEDNTFIAMIDKEVNEFFIHIENNLSAKTYDNITTTLLDNDKVVPVVISLALYLSAAHKFSIFIA
ncbi:MAG: hypothetical protein HRT88_01350 [Lentisphaeraceae bacterium]|nr:hypothetical protein [Lentisphaeraceae bacterium]